MPGSAASQQGRRRGSYDDGIKIAPVRFVVIPAVMLYSAVNPNNTPREAEQCTNKVVGENDMALKDKVRKLRGSSAGESQATQGREEETAKVPEPEKQPSAQQEQETSLPQNKETSESSASKRPWHRLSKILPARLSRSHTNKPQTELSTDASTPTPQVQASEPQERPKMVLLREMPSFSRHDATASPSPSVPAAAQPQTALVDNSDPSNRRFNVDKILSQHPHHDSKGAAGWRGSKPSFSPYPYNEYVGGKRVLAQYPHHDNKGVVQSTSSTTPSYTPYPNHQYVGGKRVLAQYAHCDDKWAAKR